VTSALVYVACALIWGTTWFAIRRCIGEGGYPTFAAAALRFAVAGVILGSLYALGAGRPGPGSRRQLAAIAACGALGAAGYGLVYAAEQSISGGLACVLYGTFPLFTAILATATRQERVTRGALLGSAVALGGVAVVFADRAQVSRAQGLGVALVLVSVFVSSLYTTLLKRIADEVNPLATTGLFLGTSALILGVVAVLFERRGLPWPPPAGPTMALFYLAVVGSVLVFAAYFFLLKRVTLMTISTLVLVEPIIALVVDAVGERDVVLGRRSYVGMAVTLAGVSISVLSGASRSRRSMPGRRTRAPQGRRPVPPGSPWTGAEEEAPSSTRGPST
jgi:probable blue pigment (indigoidine) exporter